MGQLIDFRSERCWRRPYADASDVTLASWMDTARYRCDLRMLRKLECEWNRRRDREREEFAERLRLMEEGLKR